MTKIELNKVDFKNGWNTHKILKTVSHWHLTVSADELVDIMIIETGENKFFIIDNSDDLDKPNLAFNEYTESPELYLFDSYEECLEVAVESIAKTTKLSIKKIKELL